ncbi:glycosyltransferase [Nocardioides sp. BP30]|uniref:glycosyltransferase n=1 Tax=Nocardioides sp. BP30 TaxID=3036374 RepID=UPI002468F8D4|nr:glycosyltransferase [Nocardioides sp. BP30]WGL53310.1 glycosyltransferase [Nocardioides sp. BP30]
MKVVIAHSRYRSAAPSGENAVVDEEAMLLRSAGHEVIAFERASDTIADLPFPRRAAVPAQSIWNPAVRRSLTALLRHERPDVLHVHNTFPMLSPAVLDAARDAGVPVVATLHNYKLLCASGDFFRDGAPCHRCAGGELAPAVAHGCYRGSRAAALPVVAGLAAHRERWRTLVSAYHFVSQSQHRLLAGLRLPEDRVFVSHHGVPAPAPGHLREHRVAYAGRLDAAKGIALLLAGWEAFRAAAPASPMRLIIVGDGPLGAEVRAWAASRPEVDVVGALSRDDTRGVLASSLAAVVPSAWEEAFGLTAVEAMAAGTVPILAAHGSFPELVTDGVDGVLFEHGSAPALAAALAAIEADVSRHLLIGRAARSTYRARFTPQAALERLVAIFEFAIAHPVVPTALRTVSGVQGASR